MVSSLVATMLFCAVAGAQDPPAPAGKQPAPRSKVGLGIEIDARGWPVVPDEPDRASVLPAPPRTGRERASPASPPMAAPLVEASGARSTRDSAPIASGMELGSPLLDVFQYTRSPAAFKALGGRQIWWRVTIYGPQGEVLGIREVTHVADCAFAERDRLEYENDGRAFGRSGTSVFAERQGMPWPTDAERGGHELALFGLQLRAPFCFGDGITYAVLSTGTVDRPGERLRRVLIERRPLQGTDLIGPVLDPRPRDRFELIYEPGTGKPRELVHRFASSGLARRLVFDDWRDESGVKIPFRRVYIDETLKKTTMLEILNIARERCTERTFRLH